MKILLLRELVIVSKYLNMFGRKIRFGITAATLTLAWLLRASAYD